MWKNFIPYIFISVLCFGAGYWAGHSDRPEPVQKLVRYINPGWDDKFKLIPDFQPLPRVTFIQQTRVDTHSVIKEIPVPVSYDRFRLVDDSAVSIRRDAVFLQTWNPDSRMFEVDRYDITARRWELRAYGEMSFLYPESENRLLVPGMGAELTYLKWSVVGSIHAPLSPAGKERMGLFAKVGVRRYF